MQDVDDPDYKERRRELQSLIKLREQWLHEHQAKLDDEYDKLATLWRDMAALEEKNDR